MPTTPEEILAESLPAELRITAEDTVHLDAIEAAEGETPKTRTFRGVAYSGGAMRPTGFSQGVVVDLAGMRVKSNLVPMLLGHDSGKIVGHSLKISKANAVEVEGVVSGAGDAAAEVIATAANGFPWKLSIGTTIERLVFHGEGKHVTVNGRDFKGPIYVARQTTLKEISFVPLPADDDTSAHVAASSTSQGVSDMTFEAWLEAKGFSHDDLTEDQKTALRAAYDAEQQPAEPPPAPTVAAASGDDGLDGILEARASQHERIAAIEALAEKYPGQSALMAQAIREKWTAEKTELAMLRASRPSGPAIHSPDRSASPDRLECAVRAAGAESHDMLAAEYGDETMERSEKFRRVGFRGLVEICCQMDGVPFPGPAATPDEIVAAGFSTVSLSGILGDSARKSMWRSYRDVENVPSRISRKLSTADFKTHTGYRMTGNLMMDEVGAGGEIKHATVGEESYTYSVDTYGRIFGITRRDLINDDMGVWTEIPRMIGRGAALKLQDLFWTLVLANTSDFFGSGNSNQVTGTTYALSSAGLKKAVETLRKQTDADGFPIMVQPKFLLVPPELEETAQELFVSTNVNTGGSSTTTKVPSRNIYSGRYEPVVSPYLSNSGYTGYSTTAWYLLADPADAACFGIAYLNGVERPTIEDAPLQSDILGKAWRGYMDMGVCQVDKRAGVKLTGAAE